MDEILSFDEIKNNLEIQKYLEFTDKAFARGSGHALYAAEIAGKVLKDLGYIKRDQELAKIAAYIHDIGNMISKNNHDQSSAIMFLNIIGEDVVHNHREDIFAIASAVGCHEDKSIDPVSPIAAALVFGDKTDIRHERIITAKNLKDLIYMDHKHSRAAAACREIDVVVSKEKMTIGLHIVLDTAICSVMEYFEIFISVTNYCRRASNVLGCDFELYVNGDKFL
ncbi:phosphohydrolase [Endomicrobiia bacterium]|nr:phosphohydrolase [Endomicrobiia bacterium]